MALTTITFFERFKADILSGKKTITIRDKAESDFAVGSKVRVETFENNEYFADITISAVSKIRVDNLNELHALQENMSLEQLKDIISEIYPDQKNLYVISYKLVS